MKKHLFIIPFIMTLAISACKKTEMSEKKEEIASAMAGTTTVDRLSRLPFDWITVPSGADLGDISRDFSGSEIEYLGRQFKVLSIEKLQGGSAGYSEDGFLRAANALKASNPNVAILYYWNAKLWFPNYRVANTVNQSWLTPNSTIPGTFFYKMQSAACRTWWVKHAMEMAANNNCIDGIFVDGLSTVYDNYPDAAKALLRELKDSLNRLSGPPRVIFYNSSGSHSATGECLTNENVTALHPLLNIADGAYLEGFYWKDLNRNVSTADLTHILKSLQFLAKKSKAVIVKAWPTFSFIDNNYLQSHTYDAQVAQARQDINFPLGAYLVAAGKYSYLQYSWGWIHSSTGDDHGSFIRETENSETVSPYWYAQMRRPLGRPLGNATVNGDVWTRKFDHATVTVNLQQKTASIDWHIIDFFPRG